MNNYPLFRYINESSKVHLMNSKMKILWILTTSLLLTLSKDYLSLLILGIIILYIMAKSNIRLDIYLYNLLILWPIYIFWIIFVILVSLNVTFSLFTLIKMILGISLLIILTFTTSLSEIAWGFEKLFIKLKKIKVPVTKISLRIAFSIKFISTLFERFREIRKSMAYRGVPYKSNIVMSFKKMFLPSIKVSYKLSKRTIKAMKFRFYGYSNERTNYHDNKVTSFDRMLLILNIVVLYIVIYFGWIA